MGCWFLQTKKSVQAKGGLESVLKDSGAVQPRFVGGIIEPRGKRDVAANAAVAAGTAGFCNFYHESS